MSINAKNLCGTWPALATPFSADASALDNNSLTNLVEYLLSAKVQGLVVCGSTGEAQCLSDTEYREVAQHVKEVVAGRVPLIYGIGSSSTARAQEIASFLKQNKADGILLVTPPYVKPTQSGIIEHFKAVQKIANSIPIVAYNIPGRSGTSMLPQTISKMAQEKLIIGLKDSSASLDNILEIYSYCGDSISILSGEDTLVHTIMASGGKGVISASANLVPEKFVKLTTAALDGRWRESLETQISLLEIIRTMFCETNPIPVKAALHFKGVISHASVRLPLTKASSDTLDRIRSTISI